MFYYSYSFTFIVSISIRIMCALIFSLELAVLVVHAFYVAGLEGVWSTGKTFDDGRKALLEATEK